jgi:hypothetical protein
MTPTPNRSFRARFIVEHIGTETLLYDEIRHKGFCLNQISGLIWRLAEKPHTLKRLSELTTNELQHPVTEDIVRFTLAELHRDGLLESEYEVHDVHIPTRRELVKKLGVGAALMMPLVTSIFAPTPAFAASSGGGGGCLLPDTPVSLWDGTWITAEAVQPHHVLRGIDPGTGRAHRAQVISCHNFRAEQLLTFFTASGDMVKSSPSHLFIAGAGDLLGTRASAFRAGDSIMVYNREQNRALPSTITAIQMSQVPQRVVIFELGSEKHTFVSGGIVSHNFRIKNDAARKEEPLEIPSTIKPLF